MEAPRPAATVVVARDAPAGPEVLVLRRGAGQRFLPGFVAFPGGALDPQDAAVAARWFGAPDEAARACAVRELAEELGLALTGSGLREVAGVMDAIDADPPSVSSLVEISRWVAPETESARFDARFFAVDAGGDPTDAPEPRPDGVEASSGWWAAPAALLRDEPALHHPTRSVLAALAACADVAAILGLRVEQEAAIVRASRGPR